MNTKRPRTEQKSLMCLIFIGMLIIWGCAHPISKEVRQKADEKLALAVVLEKPAAYHGSVVIWGGVITETVKHPDRSDLFISETPLDAMGKPKGREFSGGEFIARTAEHLDPQIYAAGRKVTVAGEIVGEELGTYREEPYIYVVVRIMELHLWEKQIQWDWWKIPYYWPNEYSPEEKYRGQMR